MPIFIKPLSDLIYFASELLHNLKILGWLRAKKRERILNSKKHGDDFVLQAAERLGCPRGLLSQNVLVALLAVIFSINSALAGEIKNRITIAGSATVYPFSIAVAEQFAMKTKNKTPVVEAIGTGGGFLVFCSNNGLDIANASRKIKSAEVEECRKNNVNNIIEIPIGYDAIVMAKSVGNESLSLSIDDIFLALARKIPDKNGNLIDNSNTTWRQVNPSLPNIPITVYGPSPASGTRDTFVELVMVKACNNFSSFEKVYKDQKERQGQCSLLREDGAYIEVGGNENVIIKKLENNPSALGILGFSYYETNEDYVAASYINGIKPEFEDIANGAYPISRILYIYVNGDHLKTTRGLKQFIDEYLSDSAIGDDGYLTYRSLVPLPKAMQTEFNKKIYEQIKNISN